MPIHHSIWKVGSMLTALSPSKLATEKELEDMITARPEILSPEWMLIGRQERTSFGGIVDLLAIAPDGSLVLIELKRDKTPREIVAQALDYASWVEDLKPDKIARIYERFRPEGSLDADFAQRFGAELDEDSLNSSHQMRKNGRRIARTGKPRYPCDRQHETSTFHHPPDRRGRPSRTDSCR